MSVTDYPGAFPDDSSHERRSMTQAAIVGTRNGITPVAARFTGSETPIAARARSEGLVTSPAKGSKLTSTAAAMPTNDAAAKAAS